MIIDFHTHTFPPDIAERTIPMLAKQEISLTTLMELNLTLNCL